MGNRALASGSYLSSIRTQFCPGRVGPIIVDERLKYCQDRIRLEIETFLSELDGVTREIKDPFVARSSGRPFCRRMVRDFKGQEWRYGRYTGRV